MAAATAGYEWSASPPLRHSPDTSSPMFPDRPIRPLPKRRLRARLSPEQAESIIFPPAPPSSGPLFSFPYSQTESRGNIRVGQRRGEHDHHTCTCGANHTDVESEEEDEDEERAAALPSSPSVHHNRNLTGRPVGGGGYAKPGSTSSSVDGYESFENTNNKKKRKIPNMGSAGNHHSNLSAEMAGMGITHPRELSHDEGEGGAGSYYGSSAPSTPQHSSSGTGISGAGRGRFGRTAWGRHQERRVLGMSSNLANTKASGKRPSEPTGIISTAIANTTSSPTGNENVGLLLQQEASKPIASKTQFTFTCGSDSANKMVWPGAKGGHPNSGLPQQPGAYPPSAPPSVRTAPSNTQPLVEIRPPVRPDGPMVSTQGTQTSPKINGAPHAPTTKNQSQQKPAQGGQQPQPPPRKPRRSATKMYQYAARQRQLQQEYANFHNPPSRDDMWICEFCEYESIFGVQPLALIRQYEIKDRKERKRAAEKKRLLEKARMKGRKGKKASKKAQNNANNHNNQNPPPNRYDQRLDDAPLDGQEEEYYEDEYDDLPPQTPVKACDHASCPGHHPQCPKAMGDSRATGRAPSNGA